jgi:adenylate kinase
MYVVLLGAPGSGKGTQGKILADKCHLPHLSTGDLFRNILADEAHPLFNECAVIKEGKLVSDEVVNSVVEDGLNQSQYENGVIFDGYPRTEQQGEALEAMLAKKEKRVDLVIDFNVSKEVLLHRLLGRRMCVDCKKILHTEEGYDTCPDCGGEIIQRSDDNEETISKRFEEYQTKTQPLQAYYKKQCKAYVEINIDSPSITPTDILTMMLEGMEENGIIA